MKTRRRYPAVCPECGSTCVELLEIWTGHSISFSQVDGVIPADGYLHDGAPYKVEAHCSCGKSWRLRGVVQITDMPNYEGNE